MNLHAVRIRSSLLSVAAIVALGMALAPALADGLELAAPADFEASLTPASDAHGDVSGARTLANEGRDLEVIRERYPNRRVKVEREVALDGSGNYVNHGAWKTWSEAGKLVAEGSYKMGRRDGVWTRWHQRDDSASLRQHPFNRFESPFVSQATFIDGELHGDWIIFDANQEKCSQITMERGVRSGPATIWLPGGQVYRKALYHNDVPVGDVEQLNKDGQLEVVASYLDGRRLVTKLTHFDGTKEKKTEAHYLGAKMCVSSPDDFWNARFAEYETSGEQLRHGPWKTWYSNGQVEMEGYYRNDQELGTFTWWHPNGQKAVAGQYVDGLQHGEWQWWHANGQKATAGNYQLGAQDGLWRQWTPDGRLDSQVAHQGNTPAEPLVSQPLPSPFNEGSQPLETAEKPEFPTEPWLRK